MSNTAAPAGRALWRNRPYMLLMSGKTAQIIGANVAIFAAPLIAFAVTHSVLWSGIIAGIGEIGALIATLPAGVIADRVERRGLLLLCALIGLLAWAWLVVAAVLGTLTGWQLAAVLFVNSFVTAFFAPAESASIRHIIPSEQLGSAMAAMQGRSAVAQLLAGPLGGVLYGFSRAVPLAASALGYLIVGACTWFVRVPLGHVTRAAEREHPMRQLIDGLRFTWAVPVLRTGIFVFALLNLGFTAVTVALNLHLVSQHTAPAIIGLVNASAGAAMVVGSLITPMLMRRFRSGPLAIAGVLLAVVGCVWIAFASSPLGYAAGIAIAVLLIPAVNAALDGYTAAITPPELQGRMFAALSLSASLVTPIAPAIGAFLLSILGVHAAMFVLSAVLLIGTGLMAAVKQIRRIGLPATWEADLIAWPPRR